MKSRITDIYIKFNTKNILLYNALLFLQAAFQEAIASQDTARNNLLTEFRKEMPESLKQFSQYEETDFEIYFYNMHFIELVSNIELFFIEVISLVVDKYPHKIGSQKINLSDVIELEDKSKIIEKACAEYLYDLTYKKPNDYKKDFLKILSAEGNLVDDEWPSFIEMKARRDLGVHNDWRINDTYRRKIKEVGLDPPTTQEYMYTNNKYLIRCVQLTKSIYDKILDHVHEKY